MDRLEISYKVLRKAYDRFAEGLQWIAEPDKYAFGDAKQALQESAIQRFEFSYDLIWKFLKEYLEEKYGIIASSPRSVFYESQRQKLMTQEQLNVFEDMIVARNLVSHTYNEKTANDVRKKLKDYHATIGEVLEKIQL
jgi:nucleotidyltransferase substrate binding protein (TIGR01987 family)